MKYYFLYSLLLLQFTSISAQPPAGYYNTASGLTGTALQQALHDIIDNHTVVTYSDLWTHFQTTDKRSDGKVWDMYSDIASGTPAYLYTFGINQCGEYNSEGDCYNREHSFPKSWFGGEVSPMYTDLFHLYPTDGWVNNKRGNLPFGITSAATWTSTNGSRLGNCSYSGYSAEIFEPVNAYKGDFARSYFYMAVRYYGEDSGWPGSDMVTGSQPKAWALKMLMEWDVSDPVSLKETNRNNAVYTIQGNRNPFIDNTSYANLIWGSTIGIEDNSAEKGSLKVWPNPANDIVSIEVPDIYGSNYRLRIMDISGRVLLDNMVSGIQVNIEVSGYDPGYYILVITGGNGVLTAPLIISP